MQKKTELLSLKPLKTILPCIDPPPPFKNYGFSNSVKDSSDTTCANNSFTPITLSNFKVPDPPNLSKLKKKIDHKDVGFERALNPVGSTFIKSYNSLMNQINTEKLELSGETLEEESEEINPLIEAEIKREALETSDVSKASDIPEENPSNVSEALDLVDFISPKNHILKSKDQRSLKDTSKQNLENLLKIFDSEDSQDSNLLLRPKSENEDLDEELIETLKVTKKECKVWNSSSEEKKFYSYSRIRENTDNLIFCIAKEGNFSFYSYSKLEIYNQYSKCHTQMYFHLKVRILRNVSERVEDLEIFWIPMIQIVRLLEYSHPVYEIEKTKFSMNLYNLKPIRLSK